MEDLLPAKEQLDSLKIGEKFEIEKPQTYYSAIRNHFKKTQCKRFSIRTQWGTGKKFAIRLKDRIII